MNTYRWTVVSLTLLLSTSCNAQNTLHSFPGLQDRIVEYYRAEQAGDWEHAYEMRSPDFQQTVLKSMYVAEMRKDDAGWKLLDYKIESVRKKQDRVYVHIKFSEEPPPDASLNKMLLRHLPPGTNPLKMFVMDDDSIWVLINGTWYAEGAGDRLHLSLDAPID